MPDATCRGCGAPILWAYTERGKRMPLDTAPSEPLPGTYRVAGQHGHPPSPLTDPPGTTYHMNHWTTCPVASSFKTPKETS